MKHWYGKDDIRYQTISILSRFNPIHWSSSQLIQSHQKLQQQKRVNSSEAQPDNHWIKSLMLIHLSSPGMC